MSSSPGKWDVRRPTARLLPGPHQSRPARRRHRTSLRRRKKSLLSAVAKPSPRATELGRGLINNVRASGCRTARTRRAALISIQVLRGAFAIPILKCRTSRNLEPRNGNGMEWRRALGNRNERVSPSSNVVQRAIDLRPATAEARQPFLPGCDRGGRTAPRNRRISAGINRRCCLDPASSCHASLHVHVCNQSPA
jgi:hypothetical protein